jgi:hypothetical protein
VDLDHQGTSDGLQRLRRPYSTVSVPIGTFFLI